DPARSHRPENEEQPIHPLYAYLYITDRHEGLILVNAATLLDGDPTNNFLRRALTYNPGGALNGAVAMTFVGHLGYVACDRGIVVVNLEDPLHPRIVGEVGSRYLRQPRAMAVQFRYAFVCDADGLKVLDITHPERPVVAQGATIPLQDARDVYVA